MLRPLEGDEDRSAFTLFYWLIQADKSATLRTRFS